MISVGDIVRHRDISNRFGIVTEVNEHIIHVEWFRENLRYMYLATELQKVS